MIKLLNLIDLNREGVCFAYGGMMSDSIWVRCLGLIAYVTSSNILDLSLLF
jgi:hypothetical protein